MSGAISLLPEHGEGGRELFLVEHDMEFATADMSSCMPIAVTTHCHGLQGSSRPGTVLTKHNHLAQEALPCFLTQWGPHMTDPTVSIRLIRMKQV